MLNESKLPKYLWNYASRYAMNVRNRCFIPRLGKTPYDALIGDTPNVSKFQPFGARCYSLVKGPKKLDPRGEEGYFVGFDPSSPAYLVYHPKNRSIKRIRVVNFNCNQHLPENAEYDEPCYSGASDVYPTGQHDESEESREPTVPTNPVAQPVNDQTAENVQNDLSTLNKEASSNTSNDEGNSNEVIPKRYPLRNRQPPAYLKDYVCEEEDLVGNVVDYVYNINCVPQSYNQAMSSNNSAKWEDAMNKELEALRENDSFTLSELPKGRKAVGGRWAYTLKTSLDGCDKFKARYVAKGYNQQKYFDYIDTFSPTARLASIRLLMQFAVNNDYFTHQMDVCTAYLNAAIDHEIFVEQPEGYVQSNQNGQKLYWKLKKSLYGLKQSGRMWNNVLHDFLLSIGFQNSLCDNCVYVRNNGGSPTIIIIWVDDIIISSPNMKYNHHYHTMVLQIYILERYTTSI